MSVSLRIGIIGGGGWLGGAIAGSILDAGLVGPRNLSLSYRSEPPRRFPNSFLTTDNQELADRSDVILLSVRPADWQALEFDAGGRLVISVMEIPIIHTTRIGRRPVCPVITTATARMP